MFFQRMCTNRQSDNATTGVQSLHEIQQELDDIVTEQGWNSNKVVSLVNENESILSKMKVS